MMSDKWFNYGIYRAINQRNAKLNCADTFLLRFDFESNVMNFMKYMFAGRKVRGTCHADDCNFVFKTCITPNVSTNSPEYQTMDIFVMRLFYFNTRTHSNKVIFRLNSIHNLLLTEIRTTRKHVNSYNGIL